MRNEDKMVYISVHKVNIYNEGWIETFCMLSERI